MSEGQSIEHEFEQRARTKNQIHYSDLDELAARVLGLPDSDAEAIEAGLQERFEIDQDQFNDLVEALLPFTRPMREPRGCILIHAFGRPSDDGKAWIALVKTEAI